LSFESVDSLQKALADEVFHYAADRKKAAGRALGTLVELVTFYTMRAWDLRNHIVIERSVPEFANPDILHNVEFSLHPVVETHALSIEPCTLPLTPAKIRRVLPLLGGKECKSTQLLSRDNLLRNACVLSDDGAAILVANLDEIKGEACRLTVCELAQEPFAVFECKRVGVEEGVRKGPQTIEKAKQGAYVARTVSSLQKVRLRNGSVQGLIEKADGSFHAEPYLKLLRRVIERHEHSLLRGFILTVGVVSNHGNWFTSDDPHKELRVLAQSYDWLLFLTDQGLSQFIDRLLLNPSPELEPARAAFLGSYSGARSGNRFTKVRIDLAVDEALRRYFQVHESDVETWYNVIAPKGRNLGDLRSDLRSLADKDWKGILNG
jgi:hypothetical protein